MKAKEVRLCQSGDTLYLWVLAADGSQCAWRGCELSPERKFLDDAEALLIKGIEYFADNYAIEPCLLDIVKKQSECVAIATLKDGKVVMRYNVEGINQNTVTYMGL